MTPLTMCENEEWRVVPSAQFLEVSNLGRVRRRHASLRSAGRAKPGHIYRVSAYKLGKRGAEYQQIAVSHEGKLVSYRVHRLVCEAFHGAPPSPLHQAAHRDGDSLNNIPSNLYWATPAENAADRARHGRLPRGDVSKIAKLTVEKVVLIREALSKGSRGSTLAAMYGVSANAISQIKNGRCWSWVKSVGDAE